MTGQLTTQNWDLMVFNDERIFYRENTEEGMSKCREIETLTHDELQHIVYHFTEVDLPLSIPFMLTIIRDKCK